MAEKLGKAKAAAKRNEIIFFMNRIRFECI